MKQKIRTKKKVISTNSLWLPELRLLNLVLTLAALLFSLSLISTRTDILFKTKRNSANSNQPNNTAWTDLGITTDPSPGNDENWSSQSEPVISDIGSSSLINLADGTVRLYTVQDGQIVYRDSTDGISFSDNQATGIGDDLTLPYEQQQLVSDPAVLQVSSNDWLMVFSQAVRQRPEAPQIDQPRNLYAARSRESRQFDRIGLILDSADNDSGLAEQPNLLLLPDGRIRLYYQSRGDRIASLVSEDNGTHWLREGERLSRFSEDPYAVYRGDYYALYYVAQTKAVSDQGRLVSQSSVRKAISTDRINFTEGSRALIEGTPAQPVLDPSLVRLKDGSERLYFRRAASVGSSVYNLYYATLKTGG